MSMFPGASSVSSSVSWVIGSSVMGSSSARGSYRSIRNVKDGRAHRYGRGPTKTSRWSKRRQDPADPPGRSGRSASPSSARLGRRLKQLQDIAVRIGEGRDPAAPILLFGNSHETHAPGEKG